MMTLPSSTANTQFSYHIKGTNMGTDSRTFDLAPTKESYIFLVTNNLVLGGLVALFGICSNVVNMIVFHKQGFTTTANISFFSLALSDFWSLLTYEGYNMFVNPLMDKSSIPVVSTEFQYLIAGWFHVCFSRVTSWITVYITAERCLSVALPLKVKQIVSPKSTTVNMCAVFCIHLMMLVPGYRIAYLDWKFVPERNRTLIGLKYRSLEYNSERLGYALITLSGIISFVAVVMLTTFLAFKLNQTTNWHSKVSTNNAHSEARSLRDKKTVKLVATIASVLIICYTPGAILCLLSVFDPEFAPSMKHNNIYFHMWSFAFLCSAINSSVNMFLYYNMSTKYRETFNGLFANCLKPGY